MQDDYCKHVRGFFIGVQYNPFKGEYFALFNCSECQSTYALPLSGKEQAARLHDISLQMIQPQLKEAQ